jgi:hypothetical protein
MAALAINATPPKRLKARLIAVTDRVKDEAFGEIATFEMPFSRFMEVSSSLLRFDQCVLSLGMHRQRVNA